MTLPIFFWIFYIIGLLFSIYIDYTPDKPYPYPMGIRTLLFFVLVGIIGYKLFWN